MIGIVFSTTEFTEATQILAQYNANQAILLWDGTEIDYALIHQQMRTGLMQKYRYCVERALPNFKINLGDLL
ncbi:hypothetical protein LEP3755_66990 (plasmid) [Leptolyngbya sp. NIES-3755]|nr:hypothetical protein LEP3755_66990 [Leptolyngbya sp. NIES-3755]